MPITIIRTHTNPTVSQMSLRGLVFTPVINPAINPTANPITTPKNTRPRLFLEGSFSMVSSDFIINLVRQNLKIHKKLDAINILFIDNLE